MNFFLRLMKKNYILSKNNNQNEKLKNKKVLIVSEVFFPEDFKINDVALEFIEKGYEVTVLTLVPTYPEGRVYPRFANSILATHHWNGIKIIRFFAITGYKSSKVLKVLKYINFMIFSSVYCIFFSRKYDYVFGFNLAALTDMVCVSLARKLFKVPSLIWVQDIWPDSFYAYGFKPNFFNRWLLKHLVDFVFKNIDRFALSSHGYFNIIKKYSKKDGDIVYCPNWADELDAVIDPIKLSKFKRVHFTFAGNVGSVQNLENVILAFMSLPNDLLAQAQLNVIGDGSALNALQNLSRNCPNVVFHGRQPRSSMGKFYDASDFLIISLLDLPIYHSTVPAKMQTYIAAKRPIFAIIKGETADIVNRFNLGLVADPSDLSDIQKHFIKCILMDPGDRKQSFDLSGDVTKSIFNRDIILEKLVSHTTRPY